MTDAELEAHIDRAGRDRVFAYAQKAGWSIANAPPKWVWVQIANEVLATSRTTPADAALKDADGENGGSHG